MVKGVLSTTMRDLPKGTVEFYEMIRRYSKEKAKQSKLDCTEASFTQREIREYSSYGQTWVKEQIRLLADFEYLIVLRGGSARQKGLYRIVADKALEELNLSMIPSPEEMTKLIEIS